MTDHREEHNKRNKHEITDLADVMHNLRPCKLILYHINTSRIYVSEYNHVMDLYIDIRQIFVYIIYFCKISIHCIQFYTENGGIKIRRIK